MGKLRSPWNTRPVFLFALGFPHVRPGNAPNNAPPCLMAKVPFVPHASTSVPYRRPQQLNAMLYSPILLRQFIRMLRSVYFRKTVVFVNSKINSQVSNRRVQSPSYSFAHGSFNRFSAIGMCFSLSQEGPNGNESIRHPDGSFPCRCRIPSDYSISSKSTGAEEAWRRPSCTLPAHSDSATYFDSQFKSQARHRVFPKSGSHDLELCTRLHSRHHLMATPTFISYLGTRRSGTLMQESIGDPVT